MSEPVCLVPASGVAARLRALADEIEPLGDDLLHAEAVRRIGPCPPYNPTHSGDDPPSAEFLAWEDALVAARRSLAVKLVVVDREAVR
jgi:hypothetical protein